MNNPEQNVPQSKDLSAEQPTIEQIEKSNPSTLNWGNIKDPELQAKAEQKVEAWLGDLQKEIAELLKKNGIRAYQMSFMHEGTRTPMLCVSGSTYGAAKLAVAAARTLRDQIEKDLTI